MEPGETGSTYTAEPGTGQKPAASHHAILKTLLALLIVVALLAGLSYVFPGIGAFFAPSSSTTELPQPEGLLIMSVAAKGQGTGSARIFPMWYYAPDAELRYEPVDKLSESPDGVNIAYQHVFSNNGGYLTFLGALDIGGIANFADIPLQVYRAEVAGASSYEDFTSRIQQAKRLTEEEGAFRQSPSVSNTGDVLYMLHVSDDPRLLFASEAESWEIRYIENNGDEYIAAKGIQPKWVSDTRFVFLKNDGLYLYDFADNTEKRIWGAEGGSVTTRMTLDVSDDAEYIAWSTPDAGLVFLIRVLSWGEPTLTLKGVVPIAAYGAVFSPDSSQVALKTLTQSEEVPGEWNTVVEFFSVDTLAPAASPLVVAGVDPNQTLITDWRP